MLIVADGVAGDYRLQTHRRRDIARADLLDLLALVGVHAQKTADALAAPLGHVVDVVT